MQPAKTMPVTAGGRLTKVIVNPLGAVRAPGNVSRTPRLRVNSPGPCGGRRSGLACLESLSPSGLSQALRSQVYDSARDSSFSSS